MLILFFFLVYLNHWKKKNGRRSPFKTKSSQKNEPNMDIFSHKDYVVANIDQDNKSV